MRAGRLRSIVDFGEERNVEDGAGGYEPNKWKTLCRCRGEYMPQGGREQMESGQLIGSGLGTLRVRYQPTVARMATSARVKIDGVVHQIRSIIDPTNRRHVLELVVERGVAPHDG